MKNNHLISAGAVTVCGCEEHPGETRYGWVAKEGNVQRLFVRIEKCAGTNPEYDVVSPIVSFAFIKDGLLMMVEKPSRVPGFKNQISDSVLNPYLNETVFQSPWLLIGEGVLADGSWSIDYVTDFRGDFIVLTGPQKLTCIINVWAVSMMRGLDKLTYSKHGLEFVFENETIGILESDKTTSLPFVTMLLADEDDRDGQIHEICWRSFDLVQQLLNTGDRKQKYGRPIDCFHNADMHVNADRTGPYDKMLPEGVKMCKDAFQLLFA